jgi:arylsulfatase A-like enzyme
MQSKRIFPVTVDRPRGWSVPFAKVVANSPAAVIVVVGIGLETAFASQRSGHALWSGGWGSLQAAAFLLWFWLTASWFAYYSALAVQGLSSSPLKTKRHLLPFLALGIATTASVAYIVSWGVFLQTGRFANWEAIRFTTTNLHMLGDYLRAADSMQFAWLGSIVLSLLIGLPLLARSLNRVGMPDHSQLRSRLGVWLGLLLVISVAQSQVTADMSLPRRVTRVVQFRHCLNPLLTLFCSTTDAWLEEPIPACLDQQQLVPLSLDSLSVTTLGKQRSVIVVAVEALRSDVIHQRHQGREITPNINRLARKGLQLSRAYAESTHSDYADVCLVSSLYPLRTRHHHYYRTEDPWPKTLLYDLLKPQGYDTAIISSQNEAWGGMDQFLQTPALDCFYHPQTSSAPTIFSDRDPGFQREMRAGALVAGKFPDAHTTDVALKWIESRGDRPFFLAMNFQSSHFPYLLPEGRPQPFQPCQLDDDIKFSNYPIEKVPQVRNAYYNALAESDRQIGRLVKRLEELGKLDEVILVVTGENGEAFHENGEIGHACNPVEPVIHVAAVIHAPELISPRVEDYPFEHVDLAPTLCGLLGVEASKNFQGIDILAEDRPPADDRLLFIHVLSPIARADAVLLGGRWKYVVSRDRPQGVLFDVVADPGERADLSAEEPELAAELAQVLARWRQQQLAYYHYPQYYGRYSPPRPPGRNR